MFNLVVIVDRGTSALKGIWAGQHQAVPRVQELIVIGTEVYIVIDVRHRVEDPNSSIEIIVVRKPC